MHSDVQTDCNGNKWKLLLYPGGRSQSTEQGWIAIGLSGARSRDDKEPLDIVYNIAVKDRNGTVHVNNGSSHVITPKVAGWGKDKYI